MPLAHNCEIRICSHEPRRYVDMLRGEFFVDSVHEITLPIVDRWLSRKYASRLYRRRLEAGIVRKSLNPLRFSFILSCCFKSIWIDFAVI